MKDDIRRTALSAFLMLMRPAARLLLRCGVSWKEAAELTKLAFVGVAADEFGKHGRPANTSRIAMMTGMGRREVKRLRDLLAEPDAGAFSDALKIVNDASRLLSGWYQDSEFTTASGAPRLLPVTGPKSFEVLAKRYAADIPPTAILKELKGVGAIRQTPAGKLRVMERYYMPSKLAAQKVARSGDVIAGLSQTVIHNLFCDPKSSRFEARASSPAVKRRAERAFQSYLEQHAMDFLEQADAWLADHEAADEDDAQVRLGVGIYMIRGDA